MVFLKVVLGYLQKAREREKEGGRELSGFLASTYPRALKTSTSVQIS